MSGQTINDRLLAARHSLAGQGLAKSVCKATTEENIGPKKKHLDYLLHCTNEPNVSIPQLANLLIERSQSASWIVVFKALVTCHHLMCYGNERFTQYLASSNCSFQLSNFMDKSSVQGLDMSTFIRRYSKYINDKALSYRSVAFDFCKVKRGKEDGTLRTMQTEKLLKTLPALQAQIDSLLDFDCTANDLTNGVINSAFMLLFRDLIRLFACYNDGIINLLEKFFEMNKKQCRDALDIYKKFLIRMDRVAEFLKVAETIGMDKSEIPDLARAPSSLLDALEAHLASLEGKKPPSGTNANSVAASQQNGTVDENVKQQALAEEEAAMNHYKEQKEQSTNPFLSSPTTATAAAPAGTAQQPQTQQILDLFGTGSGQSNAPAQAPKASDDLLQLSGNPFAEIVGGNQPPAGAAVQNGFSSILPTHGVPVNPAYSSSNVFASDTNFSAVFGSTGTSNGTSFDAFGDILQPAGQPAAQPAAPMSKQSTKVITGDLDSSLASLADSLSMGKGTPSKGMQFNSPKMGMKTGGPGWAPQQPVSGGQFRPMAPGMGAGQMGQQMGVRPGAPMMAPGQPPAPAPATGTQLDPFGAL